MREPTTNRARDGAARWRESINAIEGNSGVTEQSDIQPTRIAAGGTALMLDPAFRAGAPVPAVSGRTLGGEDSHRGRVHRGTLAEVGDPGFTELIDAAEVASPKGRVEQHHVAAHGRVDGQPRLDRADGAGHPDALAVGQGPGALTRSGCMTTVGSAGRSSGRICEFSMRSVLVATRWRLCRPRRGRGELAEEFEPAGGRREAAVGERHCGDERIRAAAAAGGLSSVTPWSASGPSRRRIHASGVPASAGPKPRRSASAWRMAASDRASPSGGTAAWANPSQVWPYVVTSSSVSR